MRSLLSNIFIITLLLIACMPANARKTRLTVKPAPADTLLINSTRHMLADTQAIRLHGYDKTRDAFKESLFVTNNSEEHLIKLTIQINYQDMNDTELHSATHTLPCDIPPGATRRLNFPSWDKQQVFHYHKSKAPLRTPSTPYKITAQVLSAETR